MKSLSALHSKLLRSRIDEEKLVVPSSLPKQSDLVVSPPLLLGYQKRWLADNSQIKVAEKSRRVGLTWVEACASVLLAAQAKGMNTIYCSYNFDMTENFINDCAFWAKHFHVAASYVEQIVLDDGDRDILTFQIRFASGFTIKALSGKPNNIRGKQARVVIDEAAFCNDLNELIKAAIALTMWGGQIRIISTHNGVDNPFNQLIEEVKRGDRTFSHHKITLKDALADGLYQRICLVTNQQWSPENEAAWIEDLYQQYGIGASEELDCVPFEAKSGEFFNRAWFKIVEPHEVPSGGLIFRFWDRAATAKEFARKSTFYTAGVKGKRVGSNIYILNAIAEQLGPADGDDLVEAIARQDGRNTNVREELEGGSAGLRAERHMAQRLKGLNYESVKPLGDKVTRAKPFASECKLGNVYLVRGDWNDEYINALHKFNGTPQPLVNDYTDSSSGLYAELQAHAPVEARPLRSARSREAINFSGY